MSTFFNTEITSPHFMLLVLCIGVIVLALILRKIQKSTSKVDMQYLILDEKTLQPSIHKLGQLIALATSTWVLVYETIQGHMSEWLFGTYMVAWAATDVANKWVGRDKDQSGPQLPPQ